jgi:hypothetical protein
MHLYGGDLVKQVFVSSTYTDLVDYRQSVCERIRQIGAVDVTMEHLGARDERPKDECVRLAKSSDIFIGVYAHRYGTIPKGEQLSITELEYQAATEAGVKRLIYMVDECVPWLPKHVDQGKQALRLETLKAKLKADHVVKFFTNKDDLAASVAADLGREFVFSLYRKVDTRKPPAKTPKSIDEWNASRIDIYKGNQNVFLVHSLRPSRNGEQSYDVAIYLLPHHSNDPKYYRTGLADVVGADFYLGPYFGNRVFRVRNNGGRIGIVISAYGPFLCMCRIQFRDGTRAMLSRYVDFEMSSKNRALTKRRRKALPVDQKVEA